MKKIKYEFCDGTVVEIEVDDATYELHQELVQEEKRNHWRETRRHISLNYLNALGIEFEDKDGDLLRELIRSEEEERLHKALKKLSDKQRTLAEKVFFENRSLRELSKILGVSHQALSQQLATILKKFKKLL